MSNEFDPQGSAALRGSEISRRARGTDQILSILELIATLDRAISANALAQELGMPRSTAYTLINQLIQREWLLKQEDGLVPGPQAGFLGHAASCTMEVERRLREIVRAVAVQTGALVELNIVDRWTQLIFCCSNGRPNSYIRSAEGARHPLPRTASARLLLAGISLDSLRAHLDRASLTLASGEVLSPEQLHRQIAEAGAAGISVGRGLIDPAIATLSLPVLTPDLRPIAAICAVTPAAEMDAYMERHLPDLRVAATDLGNLLRVTSWPLGERAYRTLWDGETRS